jgi:hypothetical protein
MEKIKFYHYTLESKLDEIIESAHIKLSIESVYDKKREKACSWVSTNPNWENTATKFSQNNVGEFLPLTFKEQVEQFGCARIEVKPSFGFINWGKIKHVAKMNLTIAKSMEEIGIQQGASPKEWFGSFKPITSDYWIKAEVYKNGEWIEYKIFEQ